ncbi:MAG: hypothetical protein JWO86_6205 [Myxococcaceae bacterium]|nr:hypothetical protein [Myxococcaceae bacterium]
MVRRPRGCALKAIAAGPILAWLLFAWPARATESPPTRLELEVHATCTNEADFWQRVNARTRRVVAGAGEDALRVTITLDTTGARTTGTLRVRSSGEPLESVRRVEGASCEEVADALSLVVALTFDPDSLATVPAPQPEPQRPPEVPKPERPSTRGPEPPPPPQQWRWSAGARGTVAAIDELPLGAGLFVELTRGRSSRAIAFRLGLTTLQTTVTVGETSARFSWLFGAPEVCPLRIRSGPLSLFPCAGAALGALSSSPIRGAPNGRTFLRPWLAPRAVVRGRLALTPRLGVELEATLDVPIVRDSYEFAGVRTYRVPVVVPTTSIGLALEL